MNKFAHRKRSEYARKSISIKTNLENSDIIYESIIQGKRVIVLITMNQYKYI